MSVWGYRVNIYYYYLDKSTDIRYMKNIMGQFTVRTTERYLRASKQRLVNIQCPLDDLFRGGLIDKHLKKQSKNVYK
jgi:hypothetical protein